MKLHCVWLHHWLCALCVLLVSACGGGSGSTNPVPVETPAGLTGCADTNSCASNPVSQIGGERVAPVQIPSNYTTTTRYPLLIAMNGAEHAAYLGLTDRVDRDQYVLVMTSGAEAGDILRRWNATPACCASEENKTSDDVAYLRDLIVEAAATYSIDTSRIGLIGHSNGGFMALRMVCDASELISSVVSIAGSTFVDDASCAPASTPVSVLDIHGDKDEVILYAGGLLFGEGYPGAQETTRRFAAHAGCNTDNPVLAPDLDVVSEVDGAETTAGILRLRAGRRYDVVDLAGWPALSAVVGAWCNR